MPEYRKLGWYDGEESVRLGLDKGGIRAALGGRVEHVQVQYRDNEIVVRSVEDRRHMP